MSDSFTYRIDVDAKGAVEGASDLAEAFEEAEEAVEDLDGTDVSVDVEADGATQAVADITEVDDAAVTLGNRDVAAEVRAITGPARAELEQVNADLDMVDGTTATATVDVAGLDDVRGKADVVDTALSGIVPALDDIGTAAGGAGEAVAGAVDEAGNFAGLASQVGALAVPIAAVGVAVGGIAEKFKKVAETKAFRTDAVDAFTESIREGDDAAEALVDRLREAGTIEFRLGEFGGHTFDFSEQISNAGLSVEHFADLVTRGQGAIDDWAAGARQAGVDTDLVGAAAAAAGQQAEFYAEGAENAARTSHLWGDSEAEVTAAAEELADAQRAQEEATAEATAAAEAQIETLTNMANAQRAAADAQFALRDAERGFAEQLAETNTVMGDAQATDAERAASLDAVAQAAGRVADADVRRATDTAAANGATLSAANAQRIWTQNMLEAAAAAQGPARTAILDYIASVEDIPPSKITEIEALIAAGDFAAAQVLLDEVSGTREVLLAADAVNTDVAGGKIDAVAEAPRTAEIGTEADTAPAEREVDGFTGKSRKTDPVSVQVNQAIAAAALLAFISAPRTTLIYVGTSGVPQSNAAIEAASRDRDSIIHVGTRGIGDVDRALNNVARDRSSTINVTVRQTTVMQRVDGG